MPRKQRRWGLAFLASAVPLPFIAVPLIAVSIHLVVFGMLLVTDGM